MSGIVIAGYSEVGYRCTQWLLDAGEPVRLVYTHPDDPNETRWFESVAELARSRGVPSTIVIILLLGGIQLITVGIIGEYVGRIYQQVRGRPRFLIRAVHGGTAADAARAASLDRDALPVPAEEVRR